MRLIRRNNRLESPDGEFFLTTHPEDEECRAYNCVVHNPSDHPLRDWTLNWRTDAGKMERLDPHLGVGHPDPDALAFDMRHGKKFHAIHGCWFTDGGYAACSAEGAAEINDMEEK